jgi:hypothetical protein
VAIEPASEVAKEFSIALKNREVNVAGKAPLHQPL